MTIGLVRLTKLQSWASFGKLTQQIFCTILDASNDSQSLKCLHTQLTAKDDEAKAKAQAKKADRNSRYNSKESSQKRRREAAAQMSPEARALISKRRKSPEARAMAKEKRREAAAQISPEVRVMENKR